MITKQHFISIAGMLRLHYKRMNLALEAGSGEYNRFTLLVHDMADVLKQHNVNFSKDRFYDYIYVDDVKPDLFIK